MIRVVLAPLVVLTAGCTDDQPVEIRASGRAVEIAGTDSSAEATCFNSIRISRGREKTFWAIEAIGRGEAGGDSCAARLPLRYGTLPPGFRTVTPPAPLEPGDYALIGSGEKVLRAAFAYPAQGGTIVNYQAGSARWCDAQYPGSSPDRFAQCRIK